MIRGRYALLERELRRHPGGGVRFNSRVHQRILEDAEAARAQSPYEINTQAIIERAFDAELSGAGRSSASGSSRPRRAC